MSSIVVAGDTSGTCTLQAPAVAGSTVLTLPAVSGTVLTSATGQTLTSPVINGMGSSILTSGTAQASTSGTSIDFTGIASWAKRVTVMFNGVSTNGTSPVQVQIGNGSIVTTGYNSIANYGATAGTYTVSTTGFITDATGVALAATNRSGLLVLDLIGSNTWVSSGNVYQIAQSVSCSCAGNSPVLSGALDRIRITTVNGTDTFDAGSINIMYE